jgi:phosphotransferase system IIA component
LSPGILVSSTNKTVIAEIMLKVELNTITLTPNLFQDKPKLSAQVETQDSVISGLKADIKLWCQELAQQGS